MKGNTEKRVISKQQLAIISVWGLFLLVSVLFYIKTIIPSHIYYTINNPYTMDSVWDKEENGWHNDVLLNTLFSDNTIYINPESWYIDYVTAFAGNVVADEELEAIIDGNKIDKDSYIYLDHIIAIQNSTLFEEDVIETINKAPDGAACLYIAEENIAELAEGIVFVHDECGNVYLRGFKSEEY